MYIERVAKDAITTTIFIFHLHLCGFINKNFLYSGSYIYTYNGIVISRIVRVRYNGINNLFNFMNYFKLRTRKS